MNKTDFKKYLIDFIIIGALGAFVIYSFATDYEIACDFLCDKR